MDKSKPKVLIVEDDFINALVLKEYFTDIFEYEHADNGLKALKLAQDEVFDVILMDINLGDPTLDGIEVMRRIRKMPTHQTTKIFAVTSYATPADCQRFLNVGFDAFFGKPLDIQKLCNTIQSVSMH